MKGNNNESIFSLKDGRKGAKLSSFLNCLFFTFLFLFLVSCQDEEPNPTSPDVAIIKKQAGDSTSDGPPPPSNPWSTDYSNGGSGYIEGWHIRSDDKFFSGYFLYGGGTVNYDDPLMMVINPSGTFGVFDRTGHFSRYGDWGQIGGWVISSSDKYTSLLGTNGYPYLFAANSSSGYVMLLKMIDYTTAYSNGGNHWFGGWHINAEDAYISGKFNSSDPSNQQILAFNYNTGWCSMLRYYSGWTSPWSNSGSGNINGWQIQSGDKYYAADFNGDGFDDLLCIRNSWAAILKFNGSGWTWIWSNGGNGTLGDWSLSAYDRTCVGNISSDCPSNEIIMTNYISGRACIYKLYNGSIVNIWNNGYNGYIGSHQLNSNNRYFVLKGIEINYTNLFTVDNLWAKTQKYTASAQEDCGAQE